MISGSISPIVKRESQSWKIVDLSVFEEYFLASEVLDDCWIARRDPINTKKKIVPIVKKLTRSY